MCFLETELGELTKVSAKLRPEQWNGIVLAIVSEE